MGSRAVIYIDGLNLYYGMLKYGPYQEYYWLNVEKYFSI